MSSKPNFQLLDALNIPNDGELEDNIIDSLVDWGMSCKEDFDQRMIEKEEFNKNISQMPQEKLCEIIVCFRYLGLMQEESVLAMEELATRRENGSLFNFEERIEELIKDLPHINIDINKMLKSFRII